MVRGSVTSTSSAWPELVVDGCPIYSIYSVSSFNRVTQSCNNWISILTFTSLESGLDSRTLVAKIYEIRSRKAGWPEWVTGINVVRIALFRAVDIQDSSKVDRLTPTTRNGLLYESSDAPLNADLTLWSQGPRSVFSNHWRSERNESRKHKNEIMLNAMKHEKNKIKFNSEYSWRLVDKDCRASFCNYVWTRRFVTNSSYR